MDFWLFPPQLIELGRGFCFRLTPRDAPIAEGAQLTGTAA
jgi:hypothetical protein